MIFKYFGTVRNGYGSVRRVGRRSVSFSDAQFFKKIAFAIFLKNVLNGTVRNGSVGSVGTVRVRVGEFLKKYSTAATLYRLRRQNPILFCICYCTNWKHIKKQKHVIKQILYIGNPVSPPAATSHWFLPSLMQQMQKRIRSALKFATRNSA